MTSSRKSKASTLPHHPKLISVQATTNLDDPVVSLLLKEYEHLRAEIMKKMEFRSQILPLAGAAGSFWLSTQEHFRTHVQIALLIFSGVVIFGVWLGMLYYMRRISRRIAVIEVEVNARVLGKPDVPILDWESERNRRRMF